MKMHRTQKLNTYEQLFNNTISENIYETKGLTNGIEVLKLVKTSSHSDIENMNKLSDEIDQIDKGDQLNIKKRCKCRRRIN